MKYKNDDIEISQRNKGKIFLIRNIKINCIKIIKYIILFNLFNNIILNNKISLIEYKSFNITLKIKGIGNKNIFSSNSNFKTVYYPNEVYINGYKTNAVTYSYYLSETDNAIGLIWYDLISNCEYMFFECTDITEIDLSNFDTSKVNLINDMFHGCSSLTSLNFSNFNTPIVTRMNGMFHNCLSLISLNLLNFDSSQVTKMNHMFHNCPSLISLNLSNFDTSQVTSMYYMFYNCSSLTSLNLSNFETSKVKDIYNMFDGCINLEYINMINFN